MQWVVSKDYSIHNMYKEFELMQATSGTTSVEVSRGCMPCVAVCELQVNSQHRVRSSCSCSKLGTVSDPRRMPTASWQAYLQSGVFFELAGRCIGRCARSLQN